MREISFEECKKVELDILVDIAKFCDEHGLTYFLTYGTLIGAIRHKGFIPWDDDIDITMPRADYDEFIRTYNQEGKIYKVVDPRSSMARHSFAKVIDTRTVKIEPMIDYEEPLGIDVDIFPLDGMPSSQSEYDKWYATLWSIYEKHTLKGLKIAYYPRLVTRVKTKMKQFFCPSQQKLLDKAKALHEKYPYETSEYVGSMECQWNWKGNRAKKEVFAKAIEWEFEGLKFNVPVGYHELLTGIYGDYMQLPPEEKRVTHHTNKTYWKE